MGELKPGVTIGEAAKTIGVSVSTVRRWADRGIIDSYRTALGHRRIVLESLDKRKSA